MSRIVSIKFNDDEFEALQRAHAASGVAGVSSHIKQVYFDALTPNLEVLQGLRSDLDRLHQGMAQLRPKDERPGDDPDLLLGIVCGLYVMVRKSVGEGIRAQADLLLDIAAIERYLRER
jgi:hypothetical protein